MQSRIVGSTYRRWTCVAFIFASAVLIFVTTPNSAAQSTIQNLQCNEILHGIVSDQQGRPAPGIKVDAWPLGVDLGMVLPEATTKTKLANTVSIISVLAGMPSFRTIHGQVILTSARFRLNSFVDTTYRKSDYPSATRMPSFRFAFLVRPRLSFYT
jgi:hypothetical protein